jgi:hypothetical protein
MLAAAAWIQNDSGLPQGPADRPVSTGVRGPPPPCGHCWQRQAPSQAGAISQCKGPQVKAAPAATLNTDGYTANDEAQHAPEQSVAKPAKFNEADPVALLLQFLVCFGNIIGRTCYTRRTRARQHGNLFVNMVGQSAIARKGTAYEDIRDVVQFADPMWVEEHIQGGLSSGEGLIFAVRDPIKKWDKTKQEEVEVDPGVSDKRLLVVETELASLLTVMQRSGNTISPLLRNAWDGNKLQTITRKEPLTATNAHISIIGHITEDELRARLTRTDMASGFANRFLFACVRRSKSLPRGNHLSDNDVEQMGEKLKRIIEVVTGDQLSGDPASRLLTMTEAAEAAWAPVYHNWGVERPGLLATLTARAAPQTLRLAMIYALLDRGTRLPCLISRPRWQCGITARHRPITSSAQRCSVTMWPTLS